MKCQNLSFKKHYQEGTFRIDTSKRQPINSLSTRLPTISLSENIASCSNGIVLAEFSDFSFHSTFQQWASDLVALLCIIVFITDLTTQKIVKQGPAITIGNRLQRVHRTRPVLKRMIGWRGLELAECIKRRIEWRILTGAPAISDTAGGRRLDLICS